MKKQLLPALSILLLTFSSFSQDIKKVSTLFFQDQFYHTSYFNPLWIKDYHYNIDGVKKLVVYNAKGAIYGRDKETVPIFLHEKTKNTDSIVYTYRDNKLIKRSKILPNYIESTILEYDGDSLRHVERYLKSGNLTPRLIQWNLDKLNTPSSANILKVQRNDVGKLRWENYNLRTINETEQITITSKYENGTNRVFEIIRKRNSDGLIISEVHKSNGVVEQDGSYDHTIQNNVRTTTISDNNKKDYKMRIKYDSINRIIEQGIYRDNTQKEFLILVKIRYSAPGASILTVYQNTKDNSTSLSKNKKETYVILKDGIYNRLEFGDRTNSIYLKNADPVKDLIQQAIYYKNGKEWGRINYNHIKENGITVRVEGILRKSGKEYAEGLIYLHEKIVRD